MRVLMTFQYFLPAYKAGGPIQSIKNLAKYLSVDNEVYIFCSNKDLDGTVLNVSVNRWLEFDENIKVYYLNQNRGRNGIGDIIDSIKPDIIFINGIYSLPFTVYPLLYKGSSKKILSARGMLHPGALSQKPTKKKIFLKAFKIFGLQKKCTYHATTDEETGYIKLFDKYATVSMVPNLPNVQAKNSLPDKHTGYLKLVSVSLISPMKNILLVLQALKKCSSRIDYDIYGPVKDNTYWELCLSEIAGLPDNINVAHKGAVEPEKIHNILSQYHCFILPSKSENFGHAIYEALSSGLPVITSHNTPWNELADANAGVNVNPENIQEVRDVLEGFAAKTNDEISLMSDAAVTYIEKKYDINNIKKQYKNMFSQS